VYALIDGKVGEGSGGNGKQDRALISRRPAR